MSSVEYNLLDSLLKICGEKGVKILDVEDILSVATFFNRVTLSQTMVTLNSRGYIDLKYSGENEYCLSLTATGVEVIKTEREKMRLAEDIRKAEESRKEEERKKVEEEKIKQEEKRILEERQRADETQKKIEADKLRIAEEERIRQQVLRRENDRAKGQSEKAKASSIIEKTNQFKDEDEIEPQNEDSASLYRKKLQEEQRLAFDERQRVLQEKVAKQEEERRAREVEQLKELAGKVGISIDENSPVYIAPTHTNYAVGKSSNTNLGNTVREDKGMSIADKQNLSIEEYQRISELISYKIEEKFDERVRLEQANEKKKAKSRNGFLAGIAIIAFLAGIVGVFVGQILSHYISIIIGG